MSIEPNSFEFQLFFTLTIILLIIKSMLAIYLAKELYVKKKKTGKLSFDFLFSLFFLIICMFVSRLLYIQFDFIYTKFNPDRYYTYPSALIWQIASFVIMLGYGIFVFVVDKKLLDFKLKGILAYILIIVGVIILIYPVNTADDFDFIASLLLIGNIVAVIIPIIFIYIGLKTPDLRKTFYSMAFGIIIYAIGANLVNTTVLELLMNTFGSQIQIAMVFLFLVFKITGLIMIIYGARRIF